MTVYHRTVWVLVGLLMGGCFKYPQQPNTLRTDTRAFAEAVQTIDGSTVRVEEVIEGRYALLLYNRHGWGSFEDTRYYNSLARLARQLADVDRFVIVEVVFDARAEDLADDPSRPGNWLRIPVDREQPLAAAVLLPGDEVLTYFVEPGWPPRRFRTRGLAGREIDERDLGALADLALGFPVAQFAGRWTYDDFIARYAGVADLEHFEQDGVKWIAARYRNTATNHDVLAYFERDGWHVNAAAFQDPSSVWVTRHERTHAHPATVCVSGLGVLFDKADLAAIAPDAETAHGRIDPGAQVWVSAVTLWDREHASEFSARDSVSSPDRPRARCLDVPPGSYRLVIEVRSVNRQAGSRAAATNIIIDVDEGEEVELDIRRLLERAAAPAPG